MPKVLSQPSEIHAAVDALRAGGKVIGFVPTMGALHDGHVSLMRIARAECDAVVVSIYVNPLQFGPSEDFSKYPRQFADDETRCAEAGVDVILHLRDEEMYPAGFATFVEVEQLVDHLCGARRPGHFRGVTTIVTKLFNLARPHRAYFGQKDAQQALVIKRMAADLNTGIDVRICPIVRDPDGLAMSSRNAYLSPAHRAQAPAMFRGLSRAKELFLAGERRVGPLLDAVRAEIAKALDATIDYVEIVDTATITPQPADALVPERAVMAAAMFLGATRLIDNQLLPPDLAL